MTDKSWRKLQQRFGIFLVATLVLQETSFDFANSKFMHADKQVQVIRKFFLNACIFLKNTLLNFNEIDFLLGKM